MCLGRHTRRRVAESAHPDHSRRHGLDTAYNVFERSAWTPTGLGHRVGVHTTRSARRASSTIRTSFQRRGMHGAATAALNQHDWTSCSCRSASPTRRPRLGLPLPAILCPPRMPHDAPAYLPPTPTLRTPWRGAVEWESRRGTAADRGIGSCRRGRSARRCNSDSLRACGAWRLVLSAGQIAIRVQGDS